MYKLQLAQTAQHVTHSVCVCIVWAVPFPLKDLAHCKATIAARSYLGGKGTIQVTAELFHGTFNRTVWTSEKQAVLRWMCHTNQKYGTSKWLCTVQ